MRKFSVLIVDDSSEDRYLLKRDLDETGLEIKVFEEPDGEDALRFFDSYHEMKEKYGDDFPPLLVFVDINMPKLDGFAFLKGFSELRKKHNLQSSVVMMFSSSEREADREKALGYDFVLDYLVKGQFDTKTLTQKIEEAVGGTATS